VHAHEVAHGVEADDGAEPLRGCANLATLLARLRRLGEGQLPEVAGLRHDPPTRRNLRDVVGLVHEPSCVRHPRHEPAFRSSLGKHPSRAQLSARRPHLQVMWTWRIAGVLTPLATLMQMVGMFMPSSSSLWPIEAWLPSAQTRSAAQASCSRFSSSALQSTITTDGRAVYHATVRT